MSRDVPAIEHTMTVAHWWPTVLIHCTCTGEITLLVLSAFMQTIQCPHCKKKATAIGITVTEAGPIVDVAVTVESHIRLN